MESKAVKTQGRLLREGVGLMSRVGLAGVTIGHLAERAGMSKSGVFAHFRSKEAVQLALLDHTAALAAPAVVGSAPTEADGRPRLEAVVRRWLGWAAKAGLPGGCPVAAGLFEFDDLEGPVRDKVAAMEAAWRASLAGFVRRAVELGHFHGLLDVDQFVWELCGIYLGHHASQRFLRHADADARAWTAFQSLLNRAKPAIG